MFFTFLLAMVFANLLRDFVINPCLYWLTSSSNESVAVRYAGSSSKVCSEGNIKANNK